MARARTGKKKKRARKASAKARAKPAKAKPSARRRRPPRVKARTGPVQLWLPLQMPLGLLGGVAVTPELQDVADASSTGQAERGASLGEQSSLFD